MYQDIAQIAVKETADDDLALVQASRNGNTAAFEELIKRYDRKLLRIALNVTRNHEDSEEAVQDTFLKAYRNLDRFQGNAKFSTWLYRIGVNVCLNRVSAKTTLGRLTEPIEEKQFVDVRAESRLGCQAVIKGDVVAEFPLYTRNYVQEGGGIQLGKSDRKERKAEEVVP